jgi:hypothetical protein
MNWLLVGSGVAAKLAAGWKDAKVWQQNWLLVGSGVAAELAACWKNDPSRNGCSVQLAVSFPARFQLCAYEI